MNKEQEEALATHLQEIANEIKTQDNAATAHPYFLVQQRRVLVGVDPAYFEKAAPAWILDGDTYTYGDEEYNELERDYLASGDTGDWSRTHQVKIWEFVSAFLTRKGAEDYIRSNAHNLNEPRIYVASAHRNPEIKTLRAVLLLALGQED